MTYSLPFGLKQKPLAHYFENGVIRFSIRDGSMFYKIKYISKSTIFELKQGKVKSKADLDKLLVVKSYTEIPTIECVKPSLDQVKS